MNVMIENRGMSGVNSGEALARLPTILAGKVDHLVVFLGMNDAMNSAKLLSVEAFKTNLTAIDVVARKAGARSVLFVTLHPVNAHYLGERHPRHPQRQRLQAHLAEYDAAIRRVAQETGALLVDWRARFLAGSPGDSVESAVEDRKGCLVRCMANSGTRDGNHLTVEGYRLLADEVAAALRGRVGAGDTIVCFGDSLTSGSHIEGEGTVTGKTYPAFLRAAFQESARLAGMTPPGWAIDVELPGGEHRRVTSTTEGVTATVTAEETSGETQTVWEGIGPGSLKELTVRLTRKPRAAGVAWRLEIENKGHAAVWKVTFPDLRIRIDDGDKVVIPSVNGRLHDASRSLSYRGQYASGGLTMQCSALYGPAGGLYVAVHDPFGSAKELDMQAAEGWLDIRWTWPVPDMGVPGTGWQMPGELVVQAFDGDWYDVAQLYRAWASKEAGWWPRGKQAGRPDTPDWFKDTPVWIMSNGPWPKRLPPIPIDQVVAKVKRFADYMGTIPCAMHWYNWHQIPFDHSYPHYFPEKEGFAQGIKELQAAGVRVMPYLNAHLWDTKLEDFETVALPAATKSRDGKVPTKGYNGNTFAAMCPATPLWQKTVEDLVMRLAGPEFGVDGVYLDQVSAQPPMLCFDPTHHHALGGGCWWTTQGYWPMLDKIRERLAVEHPGTILTSESTAEPYANRLDGYLTWLGYGNGTEAIPLFHAVYAGQVQLFGRLYKHDSWKGLAMRMKTAQALVWGEQLGWICPDVMDDPVAAAFLKRLARLRFQLLSYLSRGRMARPPAVVTDGTHVTDNWVTAHDLMVTTPTVLSGAWHRNDDRAVVVLLVNVDDAPHTLHLEFDAVAYGMDGNLLSREWNGNEDGSTRPAIQPVEASWNRAITLAPLASLAIEIQMAER